MIYKLTHIFPEKGKDLLTSKCKLEITIGYEPYESGLLWDQLEVYSYDGNTAKDVTEEYSKIGVLEDIVDGIDWETNFHQMLNDQYERQTA